MNWTPEQLPSLAGHRYAITGGNPGLGLEAAKILTGKGAHVTITARSEKKAEGALAEIRRQVPQASADFVLLDLTRPDRIKEAAEALKQHPLQAVINNAGVMQPPFTKTDEGYELQFATNHLGHFRLNSALFHHLENTSGRIVVVSSIAHKFGKIQFDDLMFERKYDPTQSYAQSKLSNIMYAFELQRRLQKRGSTVVSIACHPGYAATNLQSAGVGMDGGSRFFAGLYKITIAVIAQSATHGAYPLVLAAADPEAKPGGYYGPTGIAQMRGAVGESLIHKRAKDESVAGRLWDVTEEMVGPVFS